MAHEPSELAKRIQQCIVTFEARKLEYEAASATSNSAQIALDKAIERKNQALTQLKAELKKIDEAFQ